MELGVEPMMGDNGPPMGRGMGGNRPLMRGNRGGRGRGGGPGRPPRGGGGGINPMTFEGGRGGGLVDRGRGGGGLGDRGRGGNGRGRGGDWNRSDRDRGDKRGRGGGMGGVGGIGHMGLDDLEIGSPGLLGNGDRRGGRGEGRGMTRGMGLVGRGGRGLLGMGGPSRGLSNNSGEPSRGPQSMSRGNSWENSNREQPNGPPVHGGGAPRRGGGPPVANQPPPKRPRWEDANPPPPVVNGYPVGRPRPAEEPRPPVGVGGGGGPGISNNSYGSGDYNHGMPRGGLDGRSYSEFQGVRNCTGNQWNAGRPNVSGGDRGYAPDNTYGTGIPEFNNSACSAPYGPMDRGGGGGSGCNTGGPGYPPPVNHDLYGVPPVKPPYEMNQGRPADGGYGGSNAPPPVNSYGGTPQYEDRGRYGGNFGNYDSSQAPIGTLAGGAGYNNSGGSFPKDYMHGMVNRSGNEDRYGYDVYGGAAPQGPPPIVGAGGAPPSAYAPPRDQYGPPVGGGIVGPGGGGGGGGGYGGVRGPVGPPPTARRY